MRQKAVLEGLDCANCAMNLETMLRKKKGVRSVSVDFATLELDIDCDDFDGALKAVKEMEPSISPKAGKAVGKDDAPADADLRKERNAFAFSVFSFALSLSLLAASFFVPGRDAGESAAVYALCVAAWLLSGRKVLFSAARNLVRGSLFDENFLMASASLGAIAIGEPREAAAVMIFFLAGETLQDMAVNRSRKSIKALLDVKPSTARLFRDGVETVVDPDTLSLGDTVRVRPGERVAADGTVVSGSGNADTQALTGESLPRFLEPGTEVKSGFIVLDAMIDFRVDTRASESSAARIARLVESSRGSKAKTELFISGFARWYTPAVVGLSVGIALVLAFGFGFPAAEAARRALVLLVISCPCALVVSVPLAYFGGIGGAAGRGILVRGAQVFDALLEVRTVVFDKTGTLTTGDFSLKTLRPAVSGGEASLLRHAVIAERNSNHPAAKAILGAALEEHKSLRADDYREIPGYGVTAVLDGKRLVAGSHRILHLESIPHECADETGTMVHVAFSGEHLGSIEVSDTVKGETAGAMADLRNLGIRRIVMLSGDTESEASRVAREAGLDSFKASCLPETKLAEFEAEAAREDSGAVLFAGDGLNDAPVIARADVGVAMGMKGQDPAIETADIVIMDDSPLKIADAIRIAKRTRAIVVENIVFALSVKAMFIAAGGFGLAGMWEAVVADVGVALVAVLNSMRAMRKTV